MKKGAAETNKIGLNEVKIAQASTDRPKKMERMR
jgi:hypothetical protein